ncbi:hypothetical protein MRX96_033808 [Rhipicephalus microplus]
MLQNTKTTTTRGTGRSDPAARTRDRPCRDAQLLGPPGEYGLCLGTPVSPTVVDSRAADTHRPDAVESVAFGDCFGGAWLVVAP